MHNQRGVQSVPNVLEMTRLMSPPAPKVERSEVEIKRETILRLTWSDGSHKYEGQFNKESGLREGLGKETWENGNVYEGFYANDMRHGQGKMTGADGRCYEG